METVKSELHPEDLLPWLANGTLSGTERLEAEAHVAKCDRCRRELAYLESLRSSVAELESAQSPGEFGLNRLLRDIHRRPRQSWRRWLVPALAASLAIIVLQGVIMAKLWTQSPENIVPLGRMMIDADVLQIRFEPRATEADIHAALQAVSGSLVEGPGALGIYRVKLEPGVSGKPMEASQAIEILKLRPSVVLQVVLESKRVPAVAD